MRPHLPAKKDRRRTGRGVAWRSACRHELPPLDALQDAIPAGLAPQYAHLLAQAGNYRQEARDVDTQHAIRTSADDIAAGQLTVVPALSGSVAPLFLPQAPPKPPAAGFANHLSSAHQPPLQSLQTAPALKGHACARPPVSLRSALSVSARPSSSSACCSCSLSRAASAAAAAAARLCASSSCSVAASCCRACAAALCPVSACGQRGKGEARKVRGQVRMKQKC